jgi:hypothetical protein
VEVEPAVANAAAVPIGVVAVAVAAVVAAAVADVVVTTADVALSEVVEHPKVVVGQSAVQLMTIFGTCKPTFFQVLKSIQGSQHNYT